MLAHAINERMGRRVEYLQEEVRVLQEALALATGKRRIVFTPEQRRRLATKGRALTPEERRACCQVVRPDTILALLRQLAAKKYDSSKVRRKPGRPRKASDLRQLVLTLAAENVGWGYTKIRDALRGLKIEIGRTTIADILADAGIEPAPERGRKRTWKQFVTSHWETLFACDFFSVETLAFLSLFAACRTRPSSLGALFRHCVRDAFCWSVFSLARPLPSIASAVACAALFGDFAGTTGLSDSPRPFIIGVRPLAFPMRPTRPSSVGN
jgi:hypothetical protein